jgi:hypothetical protein
VIQRDCRIIIAEHHLRRRGAALLFRRAVPQDLQKRFGKKEIVKGLGAKTARSAQYSAHAMWNVCEEVFKAVPLSDGILGMPKE